MRGSGWLVAGALTVTAVTPSRPALADGVGYQLDHYEPTPAGDPFLVVESPWYASTRQLALDLTFDYAHDLLIAEHLDPNGVVVSDPAPIAHAGVAHLDVAASLLERVAVTASLPILLDQSGTAFAGVGPTGTTVGDPRLGARARLFGGRDDALAIDASVYLWIPIGVEDHFAGDSSVRGMARIAASGLAADNLRWAANGSVLARKAAVLATAVAPAGNTVGSELQLSAAASYLALDQRLGVGPEATLAIALTDRPQPQSRATLEVLGTARYTLDDRYALGLGVGTALAGDGAPDARVLLSLAYAPVRPRGSRFERVMVLPDANGHVGAVEVDDGHHKTLLDKAYATSEISRQTKQVHAVASSPNALPPAVVALEKNLPPSDRDGDGIRDAEDGCPTRAGVASPDPIRNGCPPSVEKVVRVARRGRPRRRGGDRRRHAARPCSDRAYASAEVGADGRVEAVAPATAHYTEHAIAALASALPPPDADGDGIHDLDDACPERAGVASPDPIRNGCPPSAERVVIVPDADGHVGGVEIDDGHTTTVLDRAYAAAEVGADGIARATPPTTQPRAIAHAIAALEKAMPIVDTDGDGVPDERDACPERAGVPSADPLRDGCPHADEKVVVVPDADGHVGGVEIDDGSHEVVLDAAYASAEVHGTTVTAIPPTTPVALLKATAALARSLPAPDRDGDGIADADDACPDRAGPPNASAARNGCPRTVEQVVVLADEYGHVGGVEVDDGTTKVVLDQAYASAEIGDDGRARGLAAEPSEVSSRYAAALAAQPPGARIIVYFTAGSEPVRDLTGPIDNLAAEVKARTGSYSIDVIGHTDQTGSERLNIKIGLQRAQLIAKKLEEAGIPADRIHALSKGSSEPAVRRKSRKVVELRNRRVEIWVR